MSDGIMNILILLAYTDLASILMLITKPGSFFKERQKENVYRKKTKKTVCNLTMKNYDVK